MANGILIVDKPNGWTSQDVAAKLRGVFHERRIGHGGTLDPMATGVLPIFVGRATRAAEFMESAEKEYIAGLRLGLVTNTQDTSGEALESRPVDVTREQLEAVLKQFAGRIQQIPPMYSALKVGGRKLCDIARAGGTVERQPRPVEIRALTAEPASLPSDFRLHVTCSGGTYIRTLCADIGDALACGGTMAALRRMAASGYPVSACRTPEELAAMEPAARVACLLPVETLFSDLPRLSLSEFHTKLCRSGCELYQTRLNLRQPYPTGARLRLYGADGTFFALGEVRDYPDGTAIKMIKLFVL